LQRDGDIFMTVGSLSQTGRSKREPNTQVILPAALPGQTYSLPTLKTMRNSLGCFTTGTWAHVGSHNTLHELKLSLFHYHWLFQPSDGVPLIPEYIFPGLTLGPNWNYLENWNENFLSTRYDLSKQKGSHDLKIGAEIRVGGDIGWWIARPRGQMNFSKLPADATTRFPASAATDPSQWNFAGLDPLGLRFTIYYASLDGGIDNHGNWSFDIPRPSIASWIGDNWQATSRLTLNLGVRNDVGWRDVAPPGLQETSIIIDSGAGYGPYDFGYRNNIRDLNNVAPRVGFALNVNKANDFVIRGGTGLYFSTAAANQPIDQSLWNGQRVIANTYVNDGKPGWVLDPTRALRHCAVGVVPLRLGQLLERDDQRRSASAQRQPHPERSEHPPAQHVQGRPVPDARHASVERRQAVWFAEGHADGRALQRL